jgi:hypothetical protein
VLLAGVIPLHAAKTPEPAAKDRLPAGLSTSDWQSIRAAHEAWRHAIEQVKDGWQARNPAQQWTTKFDGRGFEAQPQSAEWTWGLELRSYGAGEEQREVSGTAEVKTEGNVLAYHWDETVQEWFVNGGRGLEHGFTVQERPPGPTDAPLSFVLATRGPLRAAVTGDARGVDYSDKSGATVLTYSGLRVWDADGRELDARFAPAEDGVTLQVDDKSARYPLLIDPIAQQAYVKASNPQTLDFFGDSVAVSGDTVVVGGVAPNNFVAVGLPAGLSIDTTSGLIAGTPAQEGIFPVALSATGATAADTETLTLEIAADAASLKFLPPKRAVTAGKTARLTLLVANDLTRTQNVRVVFFFVGGVSGLVEPAPINFSAPGKKKATQRPKLSRVRVEIPIPDATTAGSVGVVARVGDQTASSQLTIKARR